MQDPQTPWTGARSGRDSTDLPGQGTNGQNANSFASPAFGSPAEKLPTEVQGVETGTTVVGITTDDAVVLAADRRASLGGRFVSNKDVQKIDGVHPTAALAMSGGVGAIQTLARQLTAEASLYETRRGDQMSMEALSTLAGALVRGIPVQLLLGGVDEDPHLYELDGGGGVLETGYGAGGSGMQPAYGVLEREAEDDLSRERAREVAARAVGAASERDTASGNGLTVTTVTREGVESEAFDAAEEVV